MIIENKILHIIKLTITLVLFFTVALLLIVREKNTCMGLEIVSVSEYEKLLSKKTDELDINFLFNNESAAVDKFNNVIYIAQVISKETQADQLQGVLSVKNPSYRLVIKKDENFDDIYTTATNGYSCCMLVIAPSGNCVEYQIIFTGLPVINIDGNLTGSANNGTDLYSGEITFFDPEAKETEVYRTISSEAQWHIRGNTTSKQPKKPWKVSLKNKNGENRNVSFCGLGEDDDWILNPMNLDDLKIREKLMMDLWNQNETFTSHNINMSQGEYVEVVLNGEYYGLYLLQRRLDKKYLNMSDGDILLKSRNMGVKNYVSHETMEIKYSQWSEEETFAYLKEYFNDQYIPYTNIENWIDLNIYMQFLCSVDNRYSKNIVMMLNFDDNNQYTVNYILWDTDMSLGLWWDALEKKYVYDYETTVFKNVYRLEYNELSQIYNLLDIDTATRWFEFRETLFSKEHIYNHIDKLYNTITQSGSLQRDFNKWGLYYSGVDNMENLYSFIDARMEYLDEYYKEFLS